MGDIFKPAFITTITSKSRKRFRAFIVGECLASIWSYWSGCSREYALPIDDLIAFSTLSAESVVIDFQAFELGKNVINHFYTQICGGIKFVKPVYESISIN